MCIALRYLLRETEKKCRAEPLPSRNVNLDTKRRQTHSKQLDSVIM